MAGLLSNDARKYLARRSREFGDVEFVGDQIDALTSNRYYPGEGGRAGMKALAGHPTGLGPDNPQGFSMDDYNNFIKAGYPEWAASASAKMQPVYRTYAHPADYMNLSSGGDYEGATDYNDPKFGLVRLGLYGTGNSITDDDQDELVKNLVEFGIPEENVSNALRAAKHGNRDAVAALRKYATNNKAKRIAEKSAGAMVSEYGNWIGNVNMVPGLVGEGKLGYYNPNETDAIYVDSELADNRGTTNHELMHRGIESLQRQYALSGNDPNYFKDKLGSDYPFHVNTSNKTLAINPDDGKRVSIDDFLKDRKIGRGRQGVVGEGHGIEHNLINSVSRNRSKRSSNLGHMPQKSIGAENSRRIGMVMGVEKLGLLANALIDQRQRDKRNYVDYLRSEYDSPRIFGGLTGTKLHPVLQGML
tara:strand:+ start:2201 stop:3451 length:1251 start_codon:yes stop_codon:yes gene_type:complete